MCKWIEQAFHSRVNINCYGNQEEYAQLIDKKKMHISASKRYHLSVIRLAKSKNSGHIYIYAWI